MPLYLDEDTIDDAALVVAKRLSRLADGHIQLPTTWQGIAKAMNLKVEEYNVPGAGRGQFAPSPLGTIPPNPVGIVTINTGYPLLEVSRAYAHELAHAEIYQWLPPQLEENRDAWMYNGDPISVRHQVACKVEVLIFGEKPV